MHWQDITTDPSDASACRWMKEQIDAIRFACPTGVRGYVDEQIAGKSVLDVGIVRHSLTTPDRCLDPSTWRHARIRELASDCWGLDILEREVKTLERWGIPNVLVCDATSQEFLGRKFQAVHIGDVIEHVNCPVDLIRFALRHVEDDGQVYVVTPNPFCIAEMVHFFRGGIACRNAEHTAWLTPTMAMEVVHRAGGKLVGVGVTLPGIGSTPRRALARVLNVLFPPEFIGGEYLYVVRKP